MKSSSLFSFASLALFGATLAHAQAPAHLTKALELVDDIVAAQSTGIYNDGAGIPLNRYGGSWGSATDASYIRFTDEAAGVLPGNNTKCAPLVSHLLKSLYNWNWKNYSFYDPIAKGTKSTTSPAPYQYVALIKQGKGFAQQITQLNNAQPGDILTWWQVGSDTSDHAMIIVSIDWNSGLAYPSQLAGADATLAGTTFYAVQVVDSSANLHTNDSRVVSVNGVDTQIAGIGTGTIGILVNANSEIVAVTWSLPTSNYTSQPTGWLNGLHSRLKRTPAWEAVIGRLP